MQQLNKFGILVLMILFSKFALADCPSPDSIKYDASAQKYYAPGPGGIWYAGSTSYNYNISFIFIGAHGMSSTNSNVVVSQLACAYLNANATPYKILALIAPAGKFYNLITSGNKWTYYDGMGYYCGLDTPTPHDPKDCPFVLN